MKKLKYNKESSVFDEIGDGFDEMDDVDAIFDKVEAEYKIKKRSKEEIQEERELAAQETLADKRHQVELAFTQEMRALNAEIDEWWNEIKSS